MIKVGSLVEYHGHEYREAEGALGIVREIKGKRITGDSVAIVDFIGLVWGVEIAPKHRICLHYLTEVEGQCLSEPLTI